MESSDSREDNVTTDSSSPSVNPSVFIFSDAIKLVMTILQRLPNRVWELWPKEIRTRLHQRSRGSPPPWLLVTDILLRKFLHMVSLCTYLFGCRKKNDLSPSMGTYLPGCLSKHWFLSCCSYWDKIAKGAHTDLSVATIVASGNSGCYFSPNSYAEKSGCLPNDNVLSLFASDTELAPDPSPRQEINTSKPSAVASSLQQF